jgi:dienelactone hydrolase
VREYPVFVPWDGEHLATVIAVPDGPPRGLVVLATVPGAPRSHRHQLWARAAVRLAERGVASARFEFMGLDDSTGFAPQVSMAVTPLGQIMAVATFAQRAVGARAVIGAGNCLAGQAALGLAAGLEQCVGAVCVQPRLVRSRLDMVMDGVPAQRARAVIRSNGMFRALVKRVPRFDVRLRGPIREALPAALQDADVLFLYDEQWLSLRSRGYRKARSFVRRLPQASRSRFELRVLPARGLDGFNSVDIQEATLGALIEWTERCLPAAAPETDRVPGPVPSMANEAPGA